MGNRGCDRVRIVELLLDSTPDIKIAPALLEIAARNQGYDSVRYKLLGLGGCGGFAVVLDGLGSDCRVTFMTHTQSKTNIPIKTTPPPAHTQWQLTSKHRPF